MSPAGPALGFAARRNLASAHSGSPESRAFDEGRRVSEPPLHGSMSVGPARPDRASRLNLFRHPEPAGRSQRLDNRNRSLLVDSQVVDPETQQALVGVRGT